MSQLSMECVYSRESKNELTQTVKVYQLHEISKTELISLDQVPRYTERKHGLHYLH
jgi:hypothetical protein